MIEVAVSKHDMDCFDCWQKVSSNHTAAGAYSPGELVTLAQDPKQANLLWLVTARDPTLVDFDKINATSERLGTRFVPRRSSNQPDEALADSSLCGLTLKRNQACDPDVTRLVWELSGSGLFLKCGAKILHRWPASLPTGAIVVTRAPDTTVWLATQEGLVEYPIPEQIHELLSTVEPPITTR